MFIFFETLPRLVREDNYYSGKTYIWTYDKGGNILTKSEYAYTTGTLGEPLNTVNYSYGNSDWKDLLTGYNGTVINYDLSGNPLNWRNASSLSWDGRRLAGMTLADGSELAFEYNSDGLRTGKTVGNSTVQYYKFLRNNIMAYMKKILLLISVFSIAMLICSGCVIDPMQGKRPVDFPGTKWVCENPDIFFEVRKVKIHYIIVKGDETVETYDRLTNGAIGEISISGQITEIEVSISRGNTIYVRLRQDDVTEGDWGEDVLFRGKCNYYPDKLVVSVYNDEFKRLSGIPDELVFVRTNMEDTETLVHDTPVIIEIADAVT